MRTILPDREVPSFLLPEPKPRWSVRKFNRQEITTWEGVARLTDLRGWLDNPRVDVPVQEWIEEHDGRQPSDDELLEIMFESSANGDDEEAPARRRKRQNTLVELAKNIRINGVRVPLVVTSDRRILDGNRRYFASRLNYQQAESDEEREAAALVPVLVLPVSAGAADEENVLVELNFVDDWREQWPYSVVARRIYRDHVHKNMSVTDLVKKYHGWTKTRIQQAIDAAEVANDFVAHHDDAGEASELAYRKLIWFDQLRRSNRKHLGKVDFRETIFDLLLADHPPFTKTKDFEKLGDVYDDNEAWDALQGPGGPKALEKALFILKQKEFEQKENSDDRLQRVNQTLRGLLQAQSFDRVERETLEQFHDLAAEVPSPGGSSGRSVDRLVTLLDNLTSREIATLSDDVRDKLSSALERVSRQAAASGAVA